MIRKIFTKVENLKWTKLFLEINFDKIGYGEAIRYIQFVYNILRDETKTRQVLELAGGLIEKGLLQLVEVMIDSEEGLMMLVVLVSMFYDNVMHLFGPELLERLG